MGEREGEARFLFGLWCWLCTFATYWFMRLGGYKWKSAFYRRIFEAKYRDVPVATYLSLEQLATWIGLQKWRADSWEQLFDAVSYPGKVQAVGQDTEGAHYIGDCDEFAIYLTAALQKSLAQGVMPGTNIRAARFFTTTWVELDGWTPTGHNVCLLEYGPNPEGVPSYAYMDYGMPSAPFTSINDVATAIRERYAAPGGSVPIVFAIQQLDLTPEHVEWRGF